MISRIRLVACCRLLGWLLFASFVFVLFAPHVGGLVYRLSRMSFDRISSSSTVREISLVYPSPADSLLIAALPLDSRFTVSSLARVSVETTRTSLFGRELSRTHSEHILCKFQIIDAKLLEESKTTVTLNNDDMKDWRKASMYSQFRASGCSQADYPSWWPTDRRYLVAGVGDPPISFFVSPSDYRFSFRSMAITPNGRLETRFF